MNTTEIVQISYNNFQSFISAELSNYIKNQELCDVQLITNDNHFFKAHRLILSMTSKYFQRYFKVLPEANSVYLPSINQDMLDCIIEFIYTGNVCIAKNNVKQFLSAAEMLKLNGFENVKPSNFHLSLSLSIVLEEITEDEDKSKFKADTISQTEILSTEVHESSMPKQSTKTCLQNSKKVPAPSKISSHQSLKSQNKKSMNNNNVLDNNSKSCSANASSECLPNIHQSIEEPPASESDESIFSDSSSSDDGSVDIVY